MLSRINLIIYVVLAVALVALGTCGYYTIYNKGKQVEADKEEKRLRDLESKTDDAKNNALTTPDPNDQLRKDARPND